MQTDTPVIDDREIELLDAAWRAANYLTVGQIYLQDNPLLREPLTVEHVKPRLLGHWGTSPGLSLLYTHLNRVIGRTDRSVLFMTGPGHGGPAVVANVWLEGTYSEIYDEIPRDLDGMARLFRQFSTPGGIPSHVSVPTPGSIHEGGELGYALVHGFGAVFDNPDLLVACVVGDGEAETAPLEGAWKSVRFLNAARDGAVLPILHLNEYKISGPTVLGRATDEDIRSLLGGHSYEAVFVEGDEPISVHRELAAALEYCVGRIDEIQEDARARGAATRGWDPSLAGARDAHAEGLDRSISCRWRPGGRYVPRAPGPRERGEDEPRAPRNSGVLAPQLPARGSVRRRWPTQARGARAHSRRPACGWGPTRAPTVVGSSSRSTCLTLRCSPSR